MCESILKLYNDEYLGKYIENERLESRYYGPAS